MKIFVSHAIENGLCQQMCNGMFLPQQIYELFTISLVRTEMNVKVNGGIFFKSSVSRMSLTVVDKSFDIFANFRLNVTFDKKASNGMCVTHFDGTISKHIILQICVKTIKMSAMINRTSMSAQFFPYCRNLVTSKTYTHKIHINYTI